MHLLFEGSWNENRCLATLKSIKEIINNLRVNVILGDAVSKLETLIWILNHISRFIAWHLFTLKASYLVKMTNLNMIFHVVVPVYRCVKIWNSPQCPAEFRNSKFYWFLILQNDRKLMWQKQQQVGGHMACAPLVNLVEWKFESEASESAERKLPSSII